MNQSINAALVIPVINEIEQLNKQLAEHGYELALRKLPSMEVVPFDFGFVFTKDSNIVELYVDDALRVALTDMTKEHGQVFIKVNWFSPDVMVVTPQEMPDPSVSLQDGPGSMEIEIP